MNSPRSVEYRRDIQLPNQELIDLAGSLYTTERELQESPHAVPLEAQGSLSGACLSETGSHAKLTWDTKDSLTTTRLSFTHPSDSNGIKFTHEPLIDLWEGGNGAWYSSGDIVNFIAPHFPLETTKHLHDINPDGALVSAVARQELARYARKKLSRTRYGSESITLGSTRVTTPDGTEEMHDFAGEAQYWLEAVEQETPDRHRVKRSLGVAADYSVGEVTITRGYEFTSWHENGLLRAVESAVVLKGSGDVTLDQIRRLGTNEHPETVTATLWETLKKLQRLREPEPTHLER